MRHIEGAPTGPAAADLDPVLAQQRGLHLLGIGAVGDEHGGQLRQLVVGVGERLEAP